MRFIFILHDQYKVVFYADETVRSSAALFTRSRRHKFAFRETISYLQSCVQWIYVDIPNEWETKKTEKFMESANGLI